MKIKKYLSAFNIFIFFAISFSACCVFKTDNPDIRIIGQNFPSTAGVGRTFSLSFTVTNKSDGDCDASTTNVSSVNLKMVNRATNVPQVNNNVTMNALANDAQQVFPFTVNIETAGTYDMTFTVDPNNTSGEVNRNNNTFTGVIIVQ
ncbi:MAG: CARDB domain-containing protein [bacterium]|nr:CARDB domain-containing protein [bacterium]